MRIELAPFMTGELVCLVGRIIGFGQMRFVGGENVLHVDPKTGLCIPMEFGDERSLVAPFHLTNMTTKIKPLLVNNQCIEDITHMWVAQNLELPVGTRFEVMGHIWAYSRDNNSKDYCFIPHGVPVQF